MQDYPRDLWRAWKAGRPLYTEPVARPRRPRSLFVRHLDCGSCNGCELELLALQNPVYDSGRFGIFFKASPRHADILALTGVFTGNLAAAAEATREAMPEPRAVTIGDCAADGGLFRDSYALASRSAALQAAIIAHVPGCPPTPAAIQECLLDLAEQLDGAG